MKKSTLITTIAMIVVVVVALSTATYAWFSAAATSTATASMTTTAAADFSLTVIKNAAAGNISWSDGISGTGLELSGASGLIAPTKTISTTVSYNTGTSTVANTASFYEASMKTTTTADVKAPAAAKGIDAIRLTRIKTNDTNATYLYVIVAVNADKANASTLYAAQATSFYVTAATSSTTKAYTNGYGVATADTATSGQTLTKGNDIATSTALAQVTFTASSSTLGTRPTYDGLTSGGFVQATKDVPDIGVSQNQYVLAYLIDLGTLALNDSIILGVYTWIDGWKADPAAAGAEYSVTYAFTSKAQNFFA